MKKSLQLSFFTVAAILLFTGIGLCGQCSWYRDIGTRWSGQIEGAGYRLTSNDIIGQYLNDDDVEPLPPGVKLKTIINEAIPGASPQQVYYLTYDMFGRVKRIKCYNPTLQKVVLAEEYVYESTAPDSFIALVRLFDPLSPENKLMAIDLYTYTDDPLVGRILKRFKAMYPDRTPLFTDEISSYDPNVFPTAYVDENPYFGTDAAFIRDTQDHVTSAHATNYDIDVDSLQQIVWFTRTDFVRNANGKLLEVKGCDTDSTFRFCWNPRSHTRYIRDASGLLKRIKNMNTGQIERRFIYSVE